jgi:phosphate starvation-inducible PhoH-like protein
MMTSIPEGLEKVKPETPNQERLLNALFNRKISLVGAFGPSGTGKSYLALAAGLRLLLEGAYSKLVIGKPVIGVTFSEHVTSAQSLESYRELVKEYLLDITTSISPDTSRLLLNLLESGRVEIADPIFLRGRTFDRTFVILDDVQNTSIEVVIEAITRLGVNSKLVVAGDPVFQHLYPSASNTAVLAWEILRNEEEAEVIDLGIKDVVRPGAKRGLRLLLETSLRRRNLDDIEKLVLNTYRLYAPDADIITVISITEAKKTFDITAEHVPDALVIVKPGHVGRAIGTGGERIEKVQEDTSMLLRVIELTLDFKEYFRALHPVSWIHNRILDADLAGPYLVVKVSRKHLGPILGQKGSYAKFMEAFLKKTFGVGLRIVEAEERRKR